ncbi:FG-nucleoporin NUP53 KNAG_0A05240 [Huiozyma naganishii CBS 8797]|uniref:RRM Nup35-type domain-containing protein n=1 Tax=Huiozyma naganishii (strain ATCC MYA-139 / BCRC 22969 / CBS 8797 / KCTC 17520 / NBRC 10181 / NCYC 3082 / Yp74L-3) TaxID=1071383 RepID=J7R064_HUIN7|nr:hypothetical protein KNAG_0A05240 [Kazachstania naganishii CBS 8797]CCK68190.1 hypothetical protein KNAG_0A05240 [Kazachstania naganishii CBS 8797]
MQDANNRFANVAVLSTQQPLQQQQHSQQSQHQMQQGQGTQQENTFILGMQTIPNSMSFNTQPLQQQEQKDPAWFNNPRKRTIPQSIVKRSLRSSGDGDAASAMAGTGKTDTANAAGFSSVTFGSRKQHSGHDATPNQSLKNTFNPEAILNDTGDVPPTLSILDWQREEEGSSGARGDVSTMLPDKSYLDGNQLTSFWSSPAPHEQQHTGTPRSVFGKDSGSNNKSGGIFGGKKDSKGLSQKENATGVAPSTATDGESASGETRTLGMTKESYESSVIVFGYPESISNRIIEHFSHFGNILEDFEVLRSPSGVDIANLKRGGKENVKARKYPIYTGDGWVKLTYDSEASALRALQENGTVQGGAPIGCIPYSKKTVEQLASCKIEASDNIGEMPSIAAVIPHQQPQSQQQQNSNSVLNQRGDTTERKAQGDNGSTFPSRVNATQNCLPFTKKLTVKDGKSLFLHNTDDNKYHFLQNLEDRLRQQDSNSKQQQTGVVHALSNWLFGWNDL